MRDVAHGPLVKKCMMGFCMQNICVKLDKMLLITYEVHWYEKEIIFVKFHKGEAILCLVSRAEGHSLPRQNVL